MTYFLLLARVGFFRVEAHQSVAGSGREVDLFRPGFDLLSGKYEIDCDCFINQP
jgi:hypothetical protein